MPPNTTRARTSTQRSKSGTLAAALTVLALSACTSTARPTAPAAPVLAAPRTTASRPTPSTPTTRPAATAPVMPEAAKAHTKAGAKAFVRYFWQVVDYAQATGDTAPIRDVSASGCGRCEAGISAIKRLQRDGGHIVGGESHVTGLKATIWRTGNTRFASVGYVNAIAAQTTAYSDLTRDEHSGPRTFRDRLTLVASGGSVWSVAAFEVIS